ncbi:MAG: N-6 DNA methylase [Candidatus Gastranaerophilales bacterium]|nr:N-6 DNA methylase [Candidatus Gastranaerophilales bacterium]
MLTKDIKRTIDNARDVLVGKIPNPQAQIEQITIAMIYKFMDDMDLETVEFGGEREFFTDDLNEYAWSKLMSKQLGNEARMNLYTEALEKLPLAKQIPELFRNIFKGAYLPFRDGQTLTLFLKEINDLDYNNSENLGNGFEYLLSIMGSQGDAGQFRTPRHIIDFIVDVVNPTKDDTILDPACGTSGFLISAYKHILKTSENTNIPLNPTELKTLTENIQGYDISPDMVKLALVNMYLHKFKQPKIYEYDTLTNQTKWDNYFDVIFANPPFMTPKGGIKPHNKFGIKANRSEVLFVDYIMEHLNSTGRAGIIVPEGIVFQSANAYKNLRKKLVDENYLYAVVSLPSGIFQPYSGVKTSILLLDRQLAKKTDKILFVEIKNDGYDLGAQRREIDKNDLPKATELIQQWQNSAIASDSEAIQSINKNPLATIVEKSKLSENGEYNLTASRYKETKDYSNCKWDMVRIDKICLLGRGRVISKKDIENNKGTYPVYSSQTADNGVLGYINTFDFEGDYATWTTDGANAGTVFSRSGKFNCTNVCGTLKAINPKNLNMTYVARVLNVVAKNYVVKLGNPKLMNKEVALIQIPLPPLEVQEEIVKELDGYQAVIDGAQKVVDNWKPTLPINPNWRKVKLGDICDIQSGGTPSRSNNEYWYNGSIPWYSSGELNNSYTTDSVDKITNLGLKDSNAKLFPKGSLLIGMYDTAAFKMSILDRDGAFNQAISGVKPNTKINMYFLYLYFSSKREDYMLHRAGARQQNLNKGYISDLEIPLIALEEQQEIVAKIEEEETAVEECKKLIKLHQAKINTKIQSIWGDTCENNN